MLKCHSPRNVSLRSHAQAKPEHKVPFSTLQSVISVDSVYNWQIQKLILQRFYYWESKSCTNLEYQMWSYCNVIKINTDGLSNDRITMDSDQHRDINSTDCPSFAPFQIEPINIRC